MKECEVVSRSFGSTESNSLTEIESVVGVTHLIHVASPIVVSQDDIENDILLPAITGTTSALKSAIKARTVKKVVVTSAFGAVADISQGWRADYAYTEVCPPFPASALSLLFSY